MQKLLQAIRSVSVVNMFAIAAINMAGRVRGGTAWAQPGAVRKSLLQLCQELLCCYQRQ